MSDLRSNEWLQGRNSDMFSMTPLVTPDVLSFNRTSVTCIQRQIKLTMDSFHTAYRAGFRLQDVTKAPLAQRRKKKKSSERSSSSESAHSHGSLTPTKGLTHSPMRNSPVRNLSSNSQGSTHSTGFTPLGGGTAVGSSNKVSSLENSGYFSFKESRIKQFMPTLSEGDQQSTVAEAGEGIIANVSASVPLASAQGTKRKLDISEVEIIEDDDCVIIGEEPGQSRQTEVLIHNNNNNSAKRLRSDTIIIE